MKTASVADLRNNFRRISAWLEAGEDVQITKRGQPYAVLKKDENEERTPPSINWREWRESIFGDRVFTEEEVEAGRRAEWEPDIASNLGLEQIDERLP